MRLKIATTLFIAISSVFSSSSVGLEMPIAYPTVFIVGEIHTEKATRIAHIEMLRRAGQGKLLLLLEGLDTSLNTRPEEIAYLVREQWGLPSNFKIANTLGIDSTIQETYDVLATFLIAQYTGESLDPYIHSVLTLLLFNIYKFNMIPIENDVRFSSFKNIFLTSGVYNPNALTAFNRVPETIRRTYLETVYRQLEISIASKDRVSIEQLKSFKPNSAMKYFVSRVPIRNAILARNIERYARNSRLTVVAMVGQLHGSGIVKYFAQYHRSLSDLTYNLSVEGLLSALRD